jgi:hypothetical protein
MRAYSKAFIDRLSHLSHPPCDTTPHTLIMAPKKGAVDLTSPESVALISRFQKTGLTESRARNIVQSTKSSSAYSRLVEEAGLDKEDAGLDEKQAGLCADLSTAGGYEAGEGKQKLTKEQVLYVVGAIKDGRLKSSDQISGRSSLCLSYQWPAAHFAFHAERSRRILPRVNTWIRLDRQGGFRQSLRSR